MSLIQEALKRKLEEQNQAPAAGVSAPPPMQPRASGPSRGGAFGRILGFLVLLLLLLTVAVALFYLAARKWNWRDALAEAKADAGQAHAKWEEAVAKSGKDAAPEPRPEAPPAVVATEAAAGAAPSPLANVRERVGDMKAKVQANHAEQAEVVQGAPAPAPAPKPTEVAQTPQPAPADADKPATETSRIGSFFSGSGDTAGAGDNRRSGAKWPRITVNGILAKGKQGGSAIINNRMVAANELVDGARVVEVQARGVLMEYKGETRLLLIGQSAD